MSSKMLEQMIMETCSALEIEYEAGQSLLTEIERALTQGDDVLSSAGQLRGILDRISTHDQRLVRLRQDWNAEPRQADAVLQTAVTSLKSKIQNLVSRIDQVLGLAQESARKLQPRLSAGAAHQRMKRAYKSTMSIDG